MGYVTVKLNSRTYRFHCADEQEERLKLVADYLGEKISDLVEELGQVGEDRILAMAALMIADELFDTREKLDKTIS